MKDSQLNGLLQLWPNIPQWAKDKVVKIATISTYKEEWKLLVFMEGSELRRKLQGHYEISTLGRIRNTGNKRITNQYYCTFAARPVHPMVARTFLGPKPKGAVVMHIDDDGSNNWVGNLKYGTYKENAQRRKEGED